MLTSTIPRKIKNTEAIEKILFAMKKQSQRSSKEERKQVMAKYGLTGKKGGKETVSIDHDAFLYF